WTSHPWGIQHPHFSSCFKVLGSGSFGEVAKCTKVGTNEIVAVKVMPKHQRAAAEDEEKALKHLCTLDPDKNNLIKFYESFTFKGNFFFVFEILDMSLFDLLDKLDWCPPSVAEIRAIAQQMLVALSALKSIGVSHTDIKSDNIMLVDHSSQPFKAKLIDFGLACKTEELSQYKTFQPVGYRAPEVHFGVQKYEGVDMFGLGCTLAHLFLGGHLFPIYSDYENSSSVFDILTSLDDLLYTSAEMKDPNQVEDTKAFIDLLKRMLSWDPADRIQPADALKHTFINMKHLPKDGSTHRTDLCFRCRGNSFSQTFSPAVRLGPRRHYELIGQLKLCLPRPICEKNEPAEGFPHVRFIFMHGTHIILGCWKLVECKQTMKQMVMSQRRSRFG
uniref:Protein kinase domain-containing protein n=1 Tax=Nothobranchius furzeri TaxID=105023 RepID=A0A8C6LA20_NOTFU